VANWLGKTANLYKTQKKGAYMCDKTSHAIKTGRGYAQRSCRSTRVWQRHRTRRA